MTSADHETARDTLIGRITAILGDDARFAAAWLGGSLGRGDGDAWSDIDLWLAVADSAVPELCNRPDGESATLSPARADLIARFGEPAVVGENPQNAGPDGVAMNVVYADSLVVVDWYLMPAVTVKRPADTLLLFEDSAIPIADPPSRAPLDERARQAAISVAMFWYFVQVTMKAIRRRDDLHGQIMLQRMRHCLWKAERLAAGDTVGHYRERGVRLASTPEEQVAEIRRLCAAMLNVMPLVEAAGGVVPRDPMKWVERLIS